MAYWPKARTPFPFVKTVIGTQQMTVVDVGARGDVPPPWLVLDGAAKIIAFEPDPQACVKLAEAYASRGNAGSYRIIPVGLTGTGGKRELFYFDAESGASVLEMSGGVWQRYGGATAPLRRMPIETRRLDDVLDDKCIDHFAMIKLDIQGAELEVLKSISPVRMAELLCIELEVFIQDDGRRPRFADFEHFLAPLGFQLFDVRAHRAPLARDSENAGYNLDIFNVHGTSRSISQRLWEFDMIYFRSADHVLEQGSARQIRQLTTALCTYNYFAEAYELVERAESAKILATEGQAIRAAVVEWHRRLRARWLDGAGRFTRAVRFFCKHAHLGDALRWGRSQWLGYPSS